MRQEAFIDVPVITLRNSDLDAISRELGAITLGAVHEASPGIADPHADGRRRGRFRYGATTRNGSIEDDDWGQLLRRVDARDVTRLSIRIDGPPTDAEVSLGLVGLDAPSGVRIRSESREELDRLTAFFDDLFRSRRDRVRQLLTRGAFAAGWTVSVGAVPALIAAVALFEPLDRSDAVLTLLVAAAGGLGSVLVLGRLLDRVAPRVIVRGWGPAPRPHEYLAHILLSLVAGAAVAVVAWMIAG